MMWVKEALHKSELPRAMEGTPAIKHQSAWFDGARDGPGPARASLNKFRTDLFRPSLTVTPQRYGRLTTT